MTNPILYKLFRKWGKADNYVALAYLGIHDGSFELHPDVVKIVIQEIEMEERCETINKKLLFFQDFKDFDGLGMA